MPTSRDVADLAGVSQATVSRVLQGGVRVRAETRERVLTAMAELGYQPHAAARAMKTGRTGSVGVVVADITNPVYPQILEALGEILEGSGTRMTLWNQSGPGSAAALDSLRQGSVDGLLFTALTAHSAPLEEVIAQGRPVVLLHRGLDGASCDQVRSDHVRGGRTVADYLLAHGRRRIAYLQGPPGISTATHRAQGFRERLAELGCPLDPRLVAMSGYSHDGGRAAALRVLATDHPPEVVHCANDLAAFGAMDAATSLGLRVPHDVWITGYDDIPMAAWDAFDLTTVHQPIRDMAACAVDLLLQRIADPRRPHRQVLLPNRLVVRGSTAHAPAGEPSG